MKSYALWKNKIFLPKISLSFLRQSVHSQCGWKFHIPTKIHAQCVWKMCEHIFSSSMPSSASSSSAVATVEVLDSLKECKQFKEQWIEFALMRSEIKMLADVSRCSTQWRQQAKNHPQKSGTQMLLIYSISMLFLRKKCSR